ncbi:MAG TPA: carboxypeptidase regulatory-like domain-containing protein [Bryobacterales bacterium]|nr:carboxypeptidase regulatory-like domain-containing protein [Bryobacterales bacterium]
MSETGPFLSRPDYSNIQVRVNDQTVPGMTNSGGNVIITPDSDPMGALQAAANSWSGVATAGVTFAPLGKTSIATGDTNRPDEINIITFDDTPGNRSVVGDAIALTNTLFDPTNGMIEDTDLVFSPKLIFSTTLQAGTYDIQSVATHELGHSLGADHSGLLGATMFYAVRTASNILSILTADDVAFLTDTYPKSPSVAASFGSISGTVNLNTGGPVAGALVTAVDPSTSTAVGSVTDFSGNYAINKLPPGRYFVYTEPMDGPVMPDQMPDWFGASGSEANVNFNTAVLGGAATPQAVPVSAGQNASVNLSVVSGTPAINIEAAGAGPVSGSIRFVSGAVPLRAGQSADFAVYGPGLDDPTISESTISFFGAPITIVKSSFSRGVTSPSKFPIVGVTIQVAPNAPPGLVTMLVRSSSAAAVYSAGIKLLGSGPAFISAGVVNGASFSPGPVAPGEIVSIFGTGLGPAAGTVGGIDPATGFLTASLAGVTVTFNNTPAPLFFVRQDQINAEAPFEIAAQSTASVVVNYQGTASAPVTVVVGPTRPGIFQVPGSSQGVVVNQDGSLCDSSHPAPRGTTVTVYATGQGGIQPPLATGQLAPLSGPLSNAQAKVTATIGSSTADVSFAGMAPNFTGLLQVNVQVPSDAPTGPSVPITLNVGGVATQANVTIAVQ